MCHTRALVHIGAIGVWVRHLHDNINEARSSTFSHLTGVEFDRCLFVEWSLDFLMNMTHSLFGFSGCRLQLYLFVCCLLFGCLFFVYLSVYLFVVVVVFFSPCSFLVFFSCFLSVFRLSLFVCAWGGYNLMREVRATWTDLMKIKVDKQSILEAVQNILGEQTVDVASLLREIASELEADGIKEKEKTRKVTPISLHAGPMFQPYPGSESQRKTIRVLLCGCFDLMHCGHFNALRQAKNAFQVHTLAHPLCKTEKFVCPK